MEKNSKKKDISGKNLALIWVILSLIVLGGATFAWFTFSTDTNVEPMAGTVGHGGAELLISNSYNGDFSTSADISINGDAENMQPVSTADLETFYTSIAQDGLGISTLFKDVTENVEDMTMTGTFFLMSKGDSCSVCFDSENFSVNSDPQFMASGRLGLKFTPDSGDSRYFIFSLDDLGSTDGAEAANTMNGDHVVISNIGGGGEADTVSDPALSVRPYSAETYDGKKYTSEESLITIQEDEKVTVDFILYIEGCDENSINAVQDRDVDIRFAFAGIDAEDE